MSCYSGSGYTKEDANGKCVDCGHDTVDGKPVDYCEWSQKTCDTCGRKPCDESC